MSDAGIVHTTGIEVPSLSFKEGILMFSSDIVEEKVRV
jgi:hypothetical protein